MVKLFEALWWMRHGGISVKYVTSIDKTAHGQDSCNVDYLVEGDNPSVRRQYQSYRLRPGLVLNIIRLDAGTLQRATSEIYDAPVLFGFTCSGSRRYTYVNGRYRNQTHEFCSGSNGIFFLPRKTGRIEYDVAQPTCLVTVLSSPELLLAYLGEGMDRAPGEFRRILEGRNDVQLAWRGADKAVKAGLLSQIVHCPYRGEFRTMFLESRVLELLTCQLGEYFDAGRGREGGAVPLRPGDIERIRAARDFLVASLEEPIRLSELAAMVGINEKKLKTGFRQVFGAPVFGYFREFRLQQARELLEKGEVNVTEAAYSVGYLSLSHFSQSFRQRFGVNPKDYLFEKRRSAPM
jgi:AraC-like DNA-binding protein